MRTKILILLAFGCLVAVLATAAACRRLAVEPEATLETVVLPYLDAIPSEYGELVGVTTHSARPNVAQLWFRRTDGSIVVVYVNYVSGSVLERALLLPRR